MAQLAGRDEFVERLEQFGTEIGVRRRAMQLQQIERIDAEILAAAIDEGFEIGLRIALQHMRIEPAPRLGRHDRALAPALLEHLANDPLRAAVAIDVGRIDEIDPGVERSVQRLARIRVGDVAPCAADRPGTETHFRNVPAGAAETAMRNLHDNSDRNERRMETGSG